MWPFRRKNKVALREEVLDGILGPRYPIESLASYRYGNAVGAAGFFIGRDLFPWKATTIRTLADHDRMRYIARDLYETNTNAKGLLNGLTGYVIGKGFAVKVVDVEDDEDEETDEITEQEQDSPEAAGAPDSPAPAAPVKSEPPKRSPLARKVGKIVAKFAKENDLVGWQREVFRRYHRDGEAFIRIFPGEECTVIRAVEPDQVRPPVGESLEGPWAFGILTKENDWDTPTKYNIVYTQEHNEQVEAHFIHHLKNNVMRNIRRGISSFWACSDELYGTSKLRYTAREGEKIRQAIAYIREHPVADKATITTLQASLHTSTTQRIDGDGVTRDVPMSRQEPGAVVDIPKGMEFKPGPAGGSTNENAMIAENQGLFAVAACWVVSSFLVTGNGDAGAYASAVVAESPMQQNVVEQQEKQVRFWEKLLEAVIEIEVEKGNLPEDTLELVAVHVSAQNPARDKKEAIEADLLLVDAGVMSDETLAGRQNLDLEEEIRKGAQKQAVSPPNPPENVPGNAETMQGKLQQDAKKPE